MLFKLFKFGCFTAVLLVVGGCGLLPNMSHDSMSNDEKAVLYMQMGLRYLGMDKLDLAKENLDKALRLDSGNAEIHNAMGEFYEHIKDYGAAEDNYETAARKASGNYNIKTNFGRFICERGNYQKGMSLLKEALDQPMNNRQWYTLTSMGVCYVKQDDLQHAEESFRQALLIQPDYAPALQEMQKISYRNRQYMSARAFLERYLAVSKHTSETLWFAFQTERALNNSKTAEEYADQLLTLFPASKEAQEIKTALGQ